MPYKIKISYATGDSNGSEDTFDHLELAWEDLEVAKANLKRIQEHYKCYRLYEYYNSYRKSYLESEEINLFESRKEKDWFAKELDDFNQRFSIVLKTDEGKDWQFGAFWCGYFERLNSIEIEMPELKITF